MPAYPQLGGGNKARGMQFKLPKLSAHKIEDKKY